MSGAHVRWTPEQRAHRSAILKAKWADPEYRARMHAKQVEAAKTPEARERARARMLRWHERRATDPVADAKWRAGLFQSQQDPKRKAALALHMRKIMHRPEMIAHTKRLGRKTAHKKLNAKGPSRRRGGQVPERFEMLYRELTAKKIPAREAYRIVLTHAQKYEARA